MVVTGGAVMCLSGSNEVVDMVEVVVVMEVVVVEVVVLVAETAVVSIA